MYVVNDWKAFKYFTDMFENGVFCGMCDCPLHDRHNSYAPDPITGEYKPYSIRVIHFKNGLDGAIARYCILHCKCRTHENLMTNILNIKGSYYFHYIVRHVPEEADADIVWSQLQNQGAEAFHSNDPQIKENASVKVVVGRK